MAPTPTTFCGTNGPTSSVTGIALNVLSNTGENDTLLLAITASASGSVPTSVTDTQNNTWTLKDSQTTNLPFLYVYECPGAAALTLTGNPGFPGSPDQITVIYNGTGSSVEIMGVDIPENAQASDVDVKATGTTGSPTKATGVLGATEENIIAFEAHLNAGGAPTWTGGFSTFGNEHNGTSNYLSAAFQTVTTNATKTAGATITSSTWNIIVISYPLAAVSVTPTISGGFVNVPYSQTLTAQGGTDSYTWAVTSGTLPTGLSLLSGVISGTPTVAGVYPFTVTATDTAGVAASQALSIEIDVTSVTSTNAFKNIAGNGNLLSVADQGGESGSITWAADLNAGAPATNTHVFLDGTHGIGWTATAAGDTSIHTGFYTVKPSKGYVASAWILSTGNSACQIGAEWYTSSGTLIGTSLGPAFTAPNVNMWQPVYAQLTTPSNAAKCKLVAYVQAASAGDLEVVELAYLAGPTTGQVLVDWINDALVGAGEANNAGGSFMDCSPWLRWDQTINMQRGRQDSISEINAGSASFVLQNDTGVFSRNKATALAGPVTGGNITLQRRVQINLTDETGAWYTRFDGLIAEIDYDGDNTGNTNLASITCADVLGYLGRTDDLSCWTRETVRADQPALTWALDDAGNVGRYGQAAESSGNNGPPLRAFDKDTSGVASLTWQDQSSGVETLADAVAISTITLPLLDGSEYWDAGAVAPNSQTRGLDSGTVGPYSTPIGSVNLIPQFTPNPNGNGKNQFVSNTGFCLFGQIPLLNPNTNDGTTDFAAEIWFTCDASGTTGGQCLYTAMVNATQVGPYIPLSLGNSRTGRCIMAGAWMGAGTTAMTFRLADYSQPPAFLANALKVSVASDDANVGTTTWVPDRPATTTGNNVVVAGGALPHHLVINVAGDPVTPTATLWLDGQEIGSINLHTGQAFDTIYIGSAFGGQGCWSGNLSVCSIYPAQLSGQQITTHCQMGQYGMWEQTTDNCVNQLTVFGVIPNYWQNMGVGNLGLSLTDYQDITGTTPLASMQVFEQAEMGLLFVNAAGQLTFHTRDWRMGYGAPDMVLPPGTFDADMGLEVTDEFMSNEAAASTATYQTGASFINNASKDAYGDYTTSSQESPTELPLITWSRAYAALGMPNLAFWPDPNLEDYAAWLANSRGEPWLVPGNLTVDFLSPDLPAGCPKISQWYALEIDNMIAASGTLPSSFADTSLANEWFIEGMNESITQSSRVLTVYCSPAAQQRAWKPGDATYGVLGSTARVGISGPDLNVVLVQSKDVSHDAGPPYVSLDTSVMAAGTINNPSLNGHDFLGATDMRSIYANLQQVIEPPMLVVGAEGVFGGLQSFATGSQANPQLQWDTIFVDTANGMGAINGWPNWYVVTVPGFYEIDASLIWSQHSTGETGSGQGWIVVAFEAAQIVAGAAAGSGLGPTSGPTYICPIGERSPFNNNSDNVLNNPTVTMYLGIGDMITVAGEQGSGSAHTAGTNFGGSKLSLRWISNSVYADRCRANTSLASGGNVTDPVLPHIQTFTYTNTATYLYYGSSSEKKSPGANQRVNTNGGCWQAQNINGHRTTGSQYGLIRMPASRMASDLGGAVSIQGVTLQGKLFNGHYSTNPKLMMGYTTASSTTVGNYNYRFNHSGDNPDLLQLTSNAGHTSTWTLPASFGKAFAFNGGTALTWGNNSTENIEYYGEWAGGPGAWTMTITAIMP